MPTAFTWRGERYRVLHMNEPWHLMDFEWEVVPEVWDGGNGRSNRFYYRLVARADVPLGEITCELYRDAAQHVWVLERIYD